MCANEAGENRAGARWGKERKNKSRTVRKGGNYLCGGDGNNRRG